jgi:ribosomal protein S18 acetylase RimI-like enzyme
MTCLIRQADTEDLPTLPAIERDAARLFLNMPELANVADSDTLSLRDHIAMLRDGVIFVAQSLEGPSAGDIVGFICGQQIAKTFHIQEMSVASASQGRGIGSALMAAMLDDAISARCVAATLITFRDVAWNERFYKKLGFRTLDADEIDDRLGALMASEVAAGLPSERRCAMMISLT